MTWLVSIMRLDLVEVWDEKRGFCEESCVIRDIPFVFVM